MNSQPPDMFKCRAPASNPPRLNTYAYQDGTVHQVSHPAFVASAWRFRRRTRFGRGVGKGQQQCAATAFDQHRVP